jgi:hypothetical protein
MEKIDFADENGAALGLDLGEVRATARRQLVASVVVAIMIALVACAAAIRPARQDVAAAGAHRIAIVEHPAFATDHGQRLAAAASHAIEFP